MNSSRDNSQNEICPDACDKKRERYTRWSWKLGGQFSELATGHADKWEEMSVTRWQVAWNGGAEAMLSDKSPGGSHQLSHSLTSYPEGRIGAALWRKSWGVLAISCCLPESLRASLKALSRAEVELNLSLEY